jgi:hypothetical protein
MKTYGLSQPLNEQAPFWPRRPRSEANGIRRGAVHGGR